MIRKIARDRHEQRVLDDINKYGWHCVNILAEGNHTEYSFTVGLFHTYQHPELIIFGLAHDIAHEILTIAANAIKRKEPIGLAVPTDALLEGYSCCFIDVPISKYYEHVGFCHWFYQSDNFPLYQIVWPTRSGLFPWHPEVTADFRIAQPIIGHLPNPM